MDKYAMALWVIMILLIPAALLEECLNKAGSTKCICECVCPETATALEKPLSTPLPSIGRAETDWRMETETTPETTGSTPLSEEGDMVGPNPELPSRGDKLRNTQPKPDHKAFVECMRKRGIEPIQSHRGTAADWAACLDEAFKDVPGY
jgi:hypothetical protein